MRLEGVEVKVNVAADDIAAAIIELGLDDDSAMRLWFYEDLSPGIQALPLLRAGIVLRTRIRAKGVTESTVKLRPCRLSQLTDDWNADTADGVTYSLEEDRSRTSRSIAASCTADHGKLQSPDGPAHRISDLLTEQQLTFLRSSAPIRVNAAEVTALGPIEATRWKSVGGGDVADLEPRAERWMVKGTQYLEISVRTTIESADSARSRLTELLAANHLAEDDSQENKTTRVLTALAVP
ncbi:MAG TPA: hypothetical protein VIT42_00715 [Microlunatus sp.]